MKSGKKISKYISLHLILFLYSLGSVCSKMASNNLFGSKQFYYFYGASLGIMCIYAVVWQQLLKKFALTVAYGNKAITVLWGLFWGKVIFQEKLTPLKVAGVLFVVFGIYMFSSEKESKGTENK